MKKTIIMCLIYTGMGAHICFGQYAVKAGVFGNGSSPTGDSNHTISGTAGQSAIGLTQSGSYIQQGGFCYQVSSLTTGVERLPDSVPETFRLEQNYPNPFHPVTTIVFSVPKPSRVTLRLFDMRGREVAVLIDEEMTTGEFKMTFDASSLASGVYIYRLEADGLIQLKKMMLLK